MSQSFCGEWLEHVGGMSATLAEWKRNSPPSITKLEDWLRPTGERAAYVASTLSGCHPMRVVELADEQFIAVCDQQIARPVDVDPDELVLFELDQQKVRSRLCSALGLSSAPAKFDQSGLLEYLDHESVASIPVYFVWEQYEPREKLRIREIIAKHRSPIMVLTPTGSGWDDEVMLTVRQHGSVLECLSKCLVDQNGAWAASSHWKSVTSQVCLKSFGDSALKPQPVQFKFEKAGAVWNLTFQGEQKSVADMLGMVYLRALLEKPWAAFYFVDILRGVWTQEAINGIAGPEDQETRKKLQDLHDDMKHNRDKHHRAKAECNVAEVGRLDGEFAALKTTVQSLRNVRHGSCRESDKHASARKAFVQALQRALKEVADKHPTAGAHFRECVKVCMNPSYIPHCVIPWEF